MVGIQELYGLLELKTSLTIKQFKNSIDELIHVYTQYLKISNQGTYDSDVDEVEQIYTRTMIKNDKETIENCKNSLGVTSLKTILENHPWVLDVDKELAKIKKEKQEDEEYSDTFKMIKNNSKVDDDDEPEE